MKIRSVLSSSLLCISIALSANITDPPKVPAPVAVQLVQWDIQSTRHLVVLNYINPLDADLHLTVYGPQGYIVHTEDLSKDERARMGFDLSGMANGEYRVTLESEGLLLSDEILSLD